MKIGDFQVIGYCKYQEVNIKTTIESVNIEIALDSFK